MNDISDDVVVVLDSELAEHYKGVATVNKGVEIDADLYERYKDVKRKLQVLETEEKFLSDKIKAQMKERTKATVNGKTVITWKARDYTSLDRQRLKEELPEVYEEYSTTKPIRYFILETPTRRAIRRRKASEKAKKERSK